MVSCNIGHLQGCLTWLNNWWLVEFLHSASSPTYPQSNGQSEKSVGIVKSLMRKSHHEGHDPYIALLQYRNTPVTGMKYSPAQLLMSRRLRDKLPCTSQTLQPQVPADARKGLKKQKLRQIRYYNRGAKPHHEFQ